MKLFSKITKEKNTLYKILGIKIKVRNKAYYHELKAKSNKEIAIQNSWNLDNLKNSENLILFLIPDECKVNGGIMSIFSLCETSREINQDSLCIISTYPNAKYPYSINNDFPNEEKIYRFSQIVDNCKNLKHLIIHIPEYFSKDFYKNLNKNEIDFLKTIKDLQINILNQNIESMPKYNEFKPLFKLTNNITQTIAHDRYATQEICNKYKIPTHLFSVNIDLTKYKSYSFEEKEKTIVLSPDKNKYKDKIVEKLKKELPNWKLITVENMTFPQYMDLISKAFFTITFGEGMDGYFCQPQFVNSVGFTVYNDDFFPDISWKELKNVYNSYDDMFNLIVNDITNISNDKKRYKNIIDDFLEKNGKIYKVNKFKDNLKRFYKKEYDFNIYKKEVMNEKK